MKRVLSGLLPNQKEEAGWELGLYEKTKHIRWLIYSGLNLGNQTETYSSAVGRRILDEKTNSNT